MKVPFGALSITEKSKRLIEEVLKTGRVSCGRYVREFEEKFAELTGTKEAIAVSSGTDALALAMAVLYDFGAKRDDEVIVPALSFIATANAVLQAGFKPVFVDVKLETLNIDTEQIESVINEKTRAILPVHLMGKPADMDKIVEIVKKYQLFIIEDAAEAHGAEYKGSKVGSLGDMGGFSLYVAHIITTVEGGIITTDRSDFAEILRSLRSHGRACKCSVCTLNTSEAYCPKRFKDGKDIRFVFERAGFSSKMNEIEAAIGIGNLEIYNDILNRRRRNLYLMIEKFKEFSDYFFTIKEEPYEKIGPHAFPIIIKKGINIKRNYLVDFLTKKGIDTRDLFSSIPTQCDGYKFLGYEKGNFPNAEYIGNNGIHIGVHQDIDEEKIDFIINVFKDFISKL
ncbi:MAG: DegT/DnrJ/EryC1/StrS family aminotransferase [Candidatus Omnitrophica bacterium]|nr:DegT/DnrJ/EryC1/StrS family aminotransferase [Candidatus Omnitrophota bacterium]